LPPWYEGPPIHIDVSAETATAAHDQLVSAPDHLAIYTDGSGIDQKIGAAAVCPQLATTRKIFLGTEAEGRAGIYTAKLQEIRIAADITKNQPNYSRIIIFTDNQAAIRTTSAPGKTSGQCLATLAALECGDVTAQGRQLTIRWIPAHTDVAGNELANKTAKEATEWAPNRRPRLPESGPVQLGRVLVSSIKTRLKRLLAKQ
jgi:ribonuclease HI